MPELRKDPIIGRWVIIATERSRRPDYTKEPVYKGDEEAFCPFCEGNESHTPAEIAAVRPRHTNPGSPGWDVRVVPSIAPFLGIEGDIERRGRGIYDITNGIGAHEVVIETNKHVANMADLSQDQIAKVIGCYVDRMNDLEKDKRFKYVLIFKNYGLPSGGSKVRHTRSQLIATPVNPKRVKEELVGAKKYYEYHERCVYCDIIAQEMRDKSRLVMEHDGFIAVAPFASRFPFEIWILPKKHSPDFVSINAEMRSNLAKILKKVLLKLKKGLDDPPYNFMIHTAPFRRSKPHGYWKTIEHDYHWHLEIMPRMTRVAGFEWGTGFYICPITPEEAAGYLREIEV